MDMAERGEWVQARSLLRGKRGPDITAVRRWIDLAEALAQERASMERAIAHEAQPNMLTRAGHNMSKKLKAQKSNWKGVYGNASTPNPWCARILIDGKQKHLGVFPTEAEAALVYDRERVANGLPRVHPQLGP